MTVTVYPTLIDKQISYILNNSETQLIFVENQEQLSKINNVRRSEETPTAKPVKDNIPAKRVKLPF